MNYIQTKLEKEIKLIGLTIRTSNEKCVADMSAFWQKFYADNVPARIPNQINPALVYGVYNNYESDYTGEYDYTIACEVSSFERVAEEMTTITLPAGNYSLFEINEKKTMHDKIGEIWNNVWNSDINRKYQIDFETYMIPPVMTDDSEVKISIYIS